MSSDISEGISILLGFPTASYSRSKLSETGNCLYIHYGDIHTKFHDIIDLDKDVLPFITDDMAKRYTKLKEGDLIISDASEDYDGVGKVVELLRVRSKCAITGLHTLHLRDKNKCFINGFRAYMLTHPKVRNSMLRSATGIKVYSISKNELKKLLLPVPKFGEQSKIKVMVDGLGLIINSKKYKLQSLKTLKKSLMQHLLTGKIRVNVENINKLLNDHAVQSVEHQDNIIKFPANPLSSGKPVERKANIHFQRSVFAAEIVHQLHGEPTFGHVKCEKIIFLAEKICKMKIGSNYKRKAAGPYDNQGFRSINSQLKKNKWYEEIKEDKRYIYQPMEKAGSHSKYFDQYFGDIRPLFEKVIKQFRKLDTKRCEIVATLYSAWEDFLNQGTIPDDEAIVNEVLNNWHESKKRIEKKRWRKALEWMRENGYVPKGALNDS